MASIDTPARELCMELTGVGSESGPAPRDLSSPLSSLWTVIEQEFDFPSRWQVPGNKEATHPTIMHLS